MPLPSHRGSASAPCGGKGCEGRVPSAIRRLRRVSRRQQHERHEATSRPRWRPRRRRSISSARRCCRDQFAALESLVDRRGSWATPGTWGRSISTPPRASRPWRRRSGWTRTPRLIEGVDAATIQGGESVGSIVTFVDGRPFKDGYRKYKIKTVKGVDDYAMIREDRHAPVSAGSRKRKEFFRTCSWWTAGPVSFRRRWRALECGGSAAGEGGIAGEAGGAGIRGGQARSRSSLPRTSPALKVLQAVRDEAHRFAQHYHHVLRGRNLFGAKAARIARSARSAKWRRQARQADSETHMNPRRRLLPQGPRPLRRTRFDKEAPRPPVGPRAHAHREALVTEKHGKLKELRVAAGQGVSPRGARRGPREVHPRRDELLVIALLLSHRVRTDNAGVRGREILSTIFDSGYDIIAGMGILSGGRQPPRRRGLSSRRSRTARTCSKRRFRLSDDMFYAIVYEIAGPVGHRRAAAADQALAGAREHLIEMGRLAAHLPQARGGALSAGGGGLLHGGGGRHARRDGLPHRGGLVGHRGHGCS